MSTISTRLTPDGVYILNGELDEVTQSTVSVGTNTVYASEFDEISINPISSGVSRREHSTGLLQVSDSFDEFSGAPIADSSLKLWVDAGIPDSYPGSGTAWSNLGTVPGSVGLFNTPFFDSQDGGGAQVFDPNSYEYGDNILDLGNMPNYTVEVWAKVTNSLSGYITAIICNEFDLSTSLNFSIGTNNAPFNYNLTAGFFDGAWRNADSSGFNPTLNTWYQFVGTYDGSTIKFFVNAGLHSSSNYVGTPGSGGSIRIARRWDSSASVATNFFPGKVSVARIYNRALTNSEILNNFNAHRGRYEI